MTRKRKGKLNNQQRYSPQPQHSFKKSKNKISTVIKALLAVSLIALIAVAWYFSTQATPSQQKGESKSYPQAVAGVFYSAPSIAADGNKVTLPHSVVDESKMVFLDLELEKQTSEFAYQGRTIPLSIYKNGNYLPLVVISTPSQKTISAIRVCEPCGSFSFHIVQGKYLECDSCGARWDIETLSGLSGGCTSFPPPQIPSSTGDNVEIDLSTLQTKVVA